MALEHFTPHPSRTQHVRRLLTKITIVTAVTIGLIMILGVMMLGGCQASGGGCRGERPPLWEDDTFGTAAFGTALIVFVPMFLSHPSKQRFVLASGVGFAAAMFIGLAMRSAYG